MGALPRPTVPDGPVSTLFERLHDLHHEAGWPSLRDMARDIGCSHTTISAAFSRPAVPRWGLLELIVEGLHGDTDEFHQLWLDASQAGRSASTAPPVASPTTATVPRQLPADVTAFTGRGAETAELDGLLRDAGAAVISGTAGVGKTALAVRWAHRVADKFPGGQLYVNLRGYDPASPVSASAALDAMLRALGVDGAAVPQDQAERAARYRTVVAGKKVLVLLDNASSVEQVRDLLPGGSSCFALVTSRDSMRGLVARHGAVRVNLDLLAMDEALQLLRTLIGTRVDDEPEPAARLAERCARLPLALRIAAELATNRPSLSLADLNSELDDEPGGLDALTTGDDEYTAVRTVFSWSRRHLSEPAAELFALLGVHPGRAVDRHAAAALSGTSSGVAARVLDELARAHLITEQRSGGFGMHDLLRGYAAELGAELSADMRAAARDRLRQYYLGSCAAALNAVYPHRPPWPTAEHFDDAEAAREWLRRQWRNVVALAEDEPASSAIQASRLLADYLVDRTRYDAALALHELARTTAARLGDRAGEGWALHNLGLIDRDRGRFDVALARHTAALAAFREVGDRSGEGRALQGIGTVRWRVGNYQEAYDALHEAVAIQREIGDRSDEGNALYGLGIASRRLGRYAEAESHHRGAIELLRAANDLAGEGRATNNLGVVHMYLGRYEEALAEFERSLEIHRQLDSRVGVAVVHDNLGSTRRRMGQLDESMTEHRAALAIYLDIGYRPGEGDALRGIGVTLGAQGRYGEAARELRRAVEVGREIGEVEITTGALTDLGEARLAAGDGAGAAENFQAALELSAQTGDPYYTARALAGSAAAHAAAGNEAGAQERWQQAYERYAEMGLPEADEVRAHLT
jgi:tetratricopeptide (TPR) repeat protein